MKNADVGDNQVPNNPNYRHFLDQQQQFDSHDDKLYVGQRFRQLEDLKHAVKMWHIKNHVTFKSKRCAKNTWVLCCPAEGCQWKLRASERKNLKVREIRMIEEPHTCVMPTISQDHNKMDSELADAMIVSGQVYTLIAAKFITEEETKSNTHFLVPPVFRPQSTMSRAFGHHHPAVKPRKPCPYHADYVRGKLHVTQIYPTHLHELPPCGYDDEQHHEYDVVSYHMCSALLRRICRKNDTWQHLGRALRTGASGRVGYLDATGRAGTQARPSWCDPTGSRLDLQHDPTRLLQQRYPSRLYAGRVPSAATCRLYDERVFRGSAL
ncbi:hypothetical protein JHK85_055765 [Glycine max]|nr:hypothetical protein JHK85_055765 [Glycine max]